MDERTKKRAAFCVLVAIVDANNGSINVLSNNIKRIYNDTIGTVTTEFLDGTIGLAYDLDFSTLNSVVTEWRDNNPIQFEHIASRMGMAH